MPTESWTAPEETAEMAAHATAVIDAALVGSGLARDAYWAAVRKGYNTPYNDPPRKDAARGHAAPPNVAAVSEVVAVHVDPVVPLPVAAMTALTAEVRAV